MPKASDYSSLPSPPASPKPSRRRSPYSHKHIIPTLKRHETLLCSPHLGGGRCLAMELSFEQLEEREEAWASSSASTNTADSQRSVESVGSG